ncbi:MAG: hypothetical protein ACYC6G_09350 [Desulfobaccales bacterium]
MPAIEAIIIDHKKLSILFCKNFIWVEDKSTVFSGPASLVLAGGNQQVTAKIAI